MHWQYTPYTLPLIFGAAFAVSVGAYVWKRKFDTPGALPFIAVQLGAAAWSLGTALELASVEQSAKLIWIQVQYLGIVTIPSMWLAFVLSYIGSRFSQRRLHLLLTVVPIATLLLVATSDQHSLLYDSTSMKMWQGKAMLVVHYGPGFWFYAIYSYLLLLIGSVLLLPVLWHSPHIYRRQAILVLIGATTPWFGNALYIFGLSPFPYLDLTPFCFILMGATVTWGLFRFHLLDVVPTARHAVLEQLDDGVIVLDSSDRIVDANPASRRLIGRPEDSPIGQQATAAFTHLPQLADLLAGDGFVSAEIAIGEGTERHYCDLRIMPLFDRQRLSGRLLVLRDITERKRTDEIMIRAQRLSAAGELSLGISHNLNNILTGILTPAQLLSEAGLEDPEMNQRLETIVTSARRARDLIQRLGRTVREGKEEALQPVVVATAVEEAVQGARPRWHHEAGARGAFIQVKTDLEELPPIAASPSGLHDILLNLLFNAVDAMPDGGEIFIRARSASPAVELSIGDTGIGMDEQTRRRIFEPFFTTKTDVGTGLGLATVYATAARWGGAIEVASEPGQGATFTLTLPIWDGPLPAADPSPEPSPSATSRPTASTAPASAEQPTASIVPAPSEKTGPMRILLVEDEAITSLVLADSLRQEGHQVDAFLSSEEALQSFQPGQYDLIMVDLGIPDLSGDQLAQRLKQRDDRLAAVLLTGWHLQEGDPRLAPFEVYIQKPFDVRRVRRAVYTALELHSRDTDS
jgi:PAS domain S-box-containing protein